MTKMVKDDLTGQEIDADDAVNFKFQWRENGRLVKCEGDTAQEEYQKLYKSMFKKPTIQVWVKHTEPERTETGQSGHWEKLAQSGHQRTTVQQ